MTHAGALLHGARGLPRTLLADLRKRVVPVYDLLIGDGVRQGRLTLSGLPAVDRMLAASGLLMVVGFLLSLLLSRAWRAGDLVPLVEAGTRYAFLPDGVMAITLVGLWLAWLLIFVGAALAGARLQVLVALLFLIVNLTMRRPLVISADGALALQIGPALVNGAYFSCGTVLLLLAVSSVRRSVHRWFRPLAVVVLVLGCSTMFGALLWIHATAVALGRPGDLPTQFHATVMQMTSAILPLVVISQLALVDFSRSFSLATVQACASPSIRWMRTVLGVVIATKVYVVIWAQREGWTDFFGSRPAATAASMLAVLFLASPFLLRRRQIRPKQEPNAEPLLYGAAALLPLTLIAAHLLIFGHLAVASQLDEGEWLVRSSTHVVDWLTTNGGLAIAVAVVVLAGWRLTRGSRGSADPVAVGALLLAAWAGTIYLCRILYADPGISVEFIDLAITAGAAGYAAVRWRQLTSHDLQVITALLLFVWLLTTQADIFGLVLGWLAAPAIVVIAVGTALTLLTGSSFARKDSALASRRARTLMWVGFLVLNLAVTNWVLLSRSFDLPAEFGRQAFYLLVPPLAAWLVLVKGFSAQSKRGASKQLV